MKAGQTSLMARPHRISLCQTQTQLTESIPQISGVLCKMNCDDFRANLMFSNIKVAFAHKERKAKLSIVMEEEYCGIDYYVNFNALNII